MGSLMAASIIKSNNFKYQWDADDIIKRFKGVFSKKHLRLMEIAFEKKLMVLVIESLFHKDQKDVKEAILFGKSFKNPKDRLIGIMQNIITDPNGKFLGNKY